MSVEGGDGELLDDESLYMTWPEWIKHTKSIIIQLL